MEPGIPPADGIVIGGGDIGISIGGGDIGISTGGGGGGSIGGGASIGGGGGAISIGGGGGDGGRNGLPTHAASAGLLMHEGSSGPVGGPGGGGGPCQYGPPSQTGSVGICMHSGSSGPVGASELNWPSETASGPATLGVAFAGAARPVSVSPTSATATAIFVIAPRTREPNSEFIDRSSKFADTDASPAIVADLLPVGAQNGYRGDVFGARN
jgi:hypothetical protein